MSKIADDVYNAMMELFPQNIIQKEHYIYYKGTRLFFDFLHKEYKILVECQGRQHFEFVKHFHGSIEAFRSQKKRDNLKLEYIEENPEYSMAYFYDEKDIITKELVLTRLLAAMEA